MTHPLIWLRNSIRTALHGTILGKILRELSARPEKGAIHFVSATRLDELQFWQSSSLGKSLQRWRNAPDVKIHIYYANSLGLPTLYNQHIRSTPRSDLLVFLHDDVSLDDPDFLTKIRKSLGYYDLAGVVGNVRLLPWQPAWCFKAIINGDFVWDVGFLSGSVRHGTSTVKNIDTFGPAPMECKVLDGLILAARCASLKRAKITFDERFKFHFYDLDFCRTAGHAGLSMGTWPIELTHDSGGAFGTSSWKEAYQAYFEKWN